MRAFVVGLVLLVGTIGQTWAEAWPSRPITLIVPYAAGGPTDTLARNLAESMSVELGQRVVVENVLGASGALAVQRVMNSEPDGYVIGIAATGTHATGPQLATVRYDPRADFTPISLVATHVMALVVKGDSPLRNAADLIAEAKANPARVTYGDPGTGTMTQLSSRFLASLAGVEIVPVGYRGAPAALIDLMGGRLGFYFDVPGSPAEFVKSGQLKMLATTGASRSSLFPHVPTMAETLPGFEIKGWFGLVAPRGLPASVTDRFNQAVKSGVKAPRMVQFLAAAGYEQSVGTPAEFQSLIERDYVRWGEILKTLAR